MPDVNEIILFDRHYDCACHSLFRDVRLLLSCFMNLSVRYIWKEENTCADHVTNKRIMMRT